MCSLIDMQIDASHLTFDPRVNARSMSLPNLVLIAAFLYSTDRHTDKLTRLKDLPVRAGIGLINTTLHRSHAQRQDVLACETLWSHKICLNN